MAKLKGINLLGTGDFTHHLWLNELKAKLEPVDAGLFIYKGVHFILTAEVNNIFYPKDGNARKIHNLIFSPSFRTSEAINAALSKFGNLAADGRPILKLGGRDLVKIVLDIDPACMVVPAHIWTPHFSLFGSNSGFDRIEECFGDQTPNIHCLETGLSSDPAMNWRLSCLDRFTLISNSDAHSLPKLGREVNVFDTEMDYDAIMSALKNKDKKRFLYTIEFFPQEGKYHWDGHRLCDLCFSPSQTKQHKGICPKCGRRLTVGVMHRVDELADRDEGFVPENAIPFKSLIPLSEIIASGLGVGVGTLSVEKEYNRLIQRLGNEFEILLKTPEEQILQNAPEKIAQGIIKVRKGEVDISPGYDGVYGKINIFGEEEKKQAKQLTLF